MEGKVMTERVKGLVVSLERDIREDDIETIVNAIKMVKGVQGVTLNIASHDDWMNRTRIKLEIEHKIYNAVREIFNDSDAK